MPGRHINDYQMRQNDAETFLYILRESSILN